MSSVVRKVTAIHNLHDFQQRYLDDMLEVVIKVPVISQSLDKIDFLGSTPDS